MRHDLEAIVARHREEWVTSTRGADLPRGEPVVVPRKTLVPAERVAEWARLYAEGITLDGIGRRYRTSGSQVRRQLLRHGYSVRTRSQGAVVRETKGPRVTKPSKQALRIVKLVRDEPDIGPAEVQRRTGSSLTTIRKALRDAGLYRRRGASGCLLEVSP